MRKYKALTKIDSEIVAGKLEAALNKLRDDVTDKDAYISMGYAEGTIERILKQLKGELPII